MRRFLDSYHLADLAGMTRGQLPWPDATAPDDAPEVDLSEV